MQLIDNIPVFGAADERTMAQIKVCQQTADHVALMADNHLGYAVPIGGVVAYYDKISPSGVGYDIACGNKAVLTDAVAADVQRDIAKIMDRVYTEISFGVGRKNAIRVDHALFDSETWKHQAVSGLKQMAQQQLGTVGSGNHYVDIMLDEQNRVWIGVHFGSRGLGHKTATWFLKAGGAKDGIDVAPLVLDAKSNLGAEYLECMSLAGQYAYAGRDWVCEEVARILGCKILSEVHNHHNFAWREVHSGKEMWVVRKGATPAFPGQKGFIGGSMGDNAVIVEGVENELAVHSLYSTVHGAGRIMSRTEARGRFQKDMDGKKQRMPGRVRHDEMQKWIKDFGVELRGADLDEAPQAYRRLDAVLAEHASTIKILHVLKPIGVAMAGKDIADPFRD